MDSLFFHPKLVHLPIALAVLMPAISVGLVIAWWRKWLPGRAWLVAVLLQITLVGSGFAALQTGEADEERVERVVAEQHIEDHEHAAQAFVWTAAAVLGVMLVGFIGVRTRAGLPAAAIATIGTLIVLGLGYRTGQSGGALVYEHGAASAYTGGAGSAPTFEHQADDHDDDD